MTTKANHRASLILKTFLSREPNLLFKAFTIYVRPLLEYCSSVWSPVYSTDIDLVERVQRTFTKRLYGFKNLSYTERLFLLHADTLELRRLKTDLIIIYKMVHNLVALSFDDFFAFNNFTITRGHDFKLTKPVCVNNARQFSFSCRLIDAWNFCLIVLFLLTVCYPLKMLDNCNFRKFLRVVL